MVAVGAHPGKEPFFVEFFGLFFHFWAVAAFEGEGVYLKFYAHVYESVQLSEVLVVVGVSFWVCQHGGITFEAHFKDGVFHAPGFREEGEFDEYIVVAPGEQFFLLYACGKVGIHHVFGGESDGQVRELFLDPGSHGVEGHLYGFRGIGVQVWVDVWGCDELSKPHVVESLDNFQAIVGGFCAIVDAWEPVGVHVSLQPKTERNVFSERRKC